MKLPLFLSTCLVTMLGWPLHSVAQAPTSSSAPTPAGLDVTLQGPWIIYTKATLNGSGGNPVPVLIVMSPGMKHIKTKYRHQQPTFSNGDGFWIQKPGIYCVFFNEVCAGGYTPASCPVSGCLASYPKALPVPVATPPRWNWYDPKSSGTYLILPLPDSTSDNSEWPMKFAAHSDYDDLHNPVVYSTTGDTENHSTGLRLHYINPIIKTLNLKKCNDAGRAPTPADCSGMTLNHDLLNIGSLDIKMKAPDKVNVCDPHVRAAYREMLSLLDPTPFENPPYGQHNVNQSIAFIDPARGVNDNYTGQYDDTTMHCRRKYDPGRKLTITEKSASTKTSDKPHDMADMFELADKTVSVLCANVGCKKTFNKETEKNELQCNSQKEGSKLLCPLLESYYNLDPNLPSISRLDSIITSISSLTDAHAPYISAYHVDKFLLNDIRELKTAADNTKVGKDCLAAIMTAN